MAENAVNNINKTFPIYNADGTSFHDLVIRKATFESVVMSLGDKISGDVFYGDNSLVFTMGEYILHEGVKYVLVNPPTVVREGLVKDNSGMNGMTKYSLTFYHPMYMLGNFPFNDVAVSLNEEKYLSSNNTFSWIGNLFDFIAKMNKNLQDTEWMVNYSFEQWTSQLHTELTVEWAKAIKMSEVLSFDKNFVSDALKTAYDTWEIPFTIEQITSGEYYTLGKKFAVVFGLPSTPILDENDQEFVFQFGKGVGLKNNSRTPKNNKIVTRICGYGSERNIPYGYPQIPWYGTSGASFTYGDHAGTYENVVIGGHTFTKLVSYPIYKGIYNGQLIELIKHPFTRKTLMPSVYAQDVFNKVSPYVEPINGVITENEDYNASLEIRDYYDAIDEENGYQYPNNVNPNAPSVEIHQFEEEYPHFDNGDNNNTIEAAIPISTSNEGNVVTERLTISAFVATLADAISNATNENEREALQKLSDYLTMLNSNPDALPTYYDGRTQDDPYEQDNTGGSYTFNCVVQPKGGAYTNVYVIEYTSGSYNTKTEVIRGNSGTITWDDTYDVEKDEYAQSYFKITLPKLYFDLYACASITQNMQINMRSGACQGCTFDVMVDWDDYKKNFYDDNGEFNPNSTKRSLTKYPNSTDESIDLIVKKDLNTFGTLMPNQYQYVQAGDEFVILGISLPQEYITRAQTSLDETMKEYMLENNVYYYDYPLKFDEHFLATNQYILSQIKNNSVVSFLYAEEPMKLYVKQMVVKYGYSVLPQWDITLTDDVEIVLNKIGQVTDDVSKLRAQFSEIQKYYSENIISQIQSKLSKVEDDVAQGRITFQQGLDALGRVVFGDEIKSDNFETGLYTGKGWRIDELGNAELESLRVRSYLEVVELLINRLQAQEGDTLFTDNDQIDKVEPIFEQVEQVLPVYGDSPKANHWYELSNGVYSLTNDVTPQALKQYYRIIAYKLSLKEKYDGYITSQMKGNILKGVINTLAAKQAGVSDFDNSNAGQQSDGSNKYYTSWMRVTETHNTKPSELSVNQIRVILYGDNLTPAGRNFVPCELMTVARWGCALQPTEAGISQAEKQSRERRQQLFYISTTDGRIAKLVGVDSPILRDDNYGTTLGNLPDFVKNSSIASRLIEGRDYLYAQGIVVGSFIQLDRYGSPILHYVDCGEWVNGSELSSEERKVGYGIYLCNEYNEDTGQWETHDVYHDGMKWRCLMHQPHTIDGSATYEEPKFGSDYWQPIEGNKNFTLEFASSRGYSFRIGNIDTVITAHLYYGGIDITNNPNVTFVGWERFLESYWNNGNSPTEAQAQRDETWNAQHTNGYGDENYDPRTLHLTNNDMPWEWSSLDKAVFNLTVQINDGEDTIIVENQIVS